MDLIQKANKLGYKHYTEFTVEELDNLSLENSNKQIEYYFIQRWLREKHNINCRVASNSLTCHFPVNEVLDEDGAEMKGITQFIIYKTYEEALEAGLQAALELINN